MAAFESYSFPSMPAPTSCPDASLVSQNMNTSRHSQSPNLSGFSKKKRSHAESVAESSPNKAASAFSSGPASADNDSDEPEKKRNKLGYQRSTIACVHCRRRKIRCMVSSKDTGGKCTHCTRMKKDCSFVPVDQSSVRAKKKRDIIQKAATASPESMSQPFAHGLNDYYPMGGSLSMEPSPSLPPSAWGSDMLSEPLYHAGMEPFPHFETIPPLSYPEAMPQVSEWDGSNFGQLSNTSAPLDDSLHATTNGSWPLSPPTHLDPHSFDMSQLPQRPASSTFDHSFHNHAKAHFNRGHSSRSFSTSDLDLPMHDHGLHRAQTISMPLSYHFSLDGSDQYISPTSSDELSKGYFKSPFPVAGEMMSSSFYDAPMTSTPLLGPEGFLSPFDSLQSASPQPPSLTMSPSNYGSGNERSGSLASVPSVLTPQSLLEAHYGSVEPQSLSTSGSMDPQYATIDPLHPISPSGETLNAAKYMLQQQQFGTDQWFTEAA